MSKYLNVQMSKCLNEQCLNDWMSKWVMSKCLNE